MSYTLGTANAHGVPISVEFTFNGTSVNWGGDNLYSMSPLSNRSESVDGSYELSDLDVELIDTNGSIWGSLGNGTSAFYKPFMATVYVGGSSDWTSYGPLGLQRVKHINNNGAATYTIHSGQIVEVSKANRKVRIKSQNNLRALEDMEWRFPYTEVDYAAYKLGSYFFYYSNIPLSFPDSICEWNEERTEFSMYVTCATTSLGAWFVLPQYAPIAGRNTLGLKEGYRFAGTQYYSDFQTVKLQGTYLGTLIGTIDSGTDANKYGYYNLINSEANRDGTRYVLNCTRLTVRDGTLPAGSSLMFQQNLSLEETPANLFRELIAGHCVTPFFSTTDIEQDSFGTSQRNTLYQTFSQKIDPKGGKVLPFLKNLISSVYGQFSVNNDNKFEFKAYGPRNLTASIGTVDGTTLLDSSLNSNRTDARNRIVLQYAFSPETNDFSKKIEVKGSGWSGTTDNLLEIKSKWIRNDDEAKTFTKRILNRFQNTSPRISLTVTMRHAGVGLGTLLNVLDPDSGLTNKVVEVVGYEKDFTENRKIAFQCIDGESVYSRKGFGQWMGGLTLPSGQVTGSSTLGWGTSGTMANINQAIYGSQFTWF